MISWSLQFKARTIKSYKIFCTVSLDYEVRDSDTLSEKLNRKLSLLEFTDYKILRKSFLGNFFLGLVQVSCMENTYDSNGFWNQFGKAI